MKDVVKLLTKDERLLWTGKSEKPVRSNARFYDSLCCNALFILFLMAIYFSIFNSENYLGLNYYPVYIIVLFVFIMVIFFERMIIKSLLQIKNNPPCYIITNKRLIQKNYEDRSILGRVNYFKLDNSLITYINDKIKSVEWKNLRMFKITSKGHYWNITLYLLNTSGKLCPFMIFKRINNYIKPKRILTELIPFQIRVYKKKIIGIRET